MFISSALSFRNMMPNGLAPKLSSNQIMLRWAVFSIPFSNVWTNNIWIVTHNLGVCPAPRILTTILTKLDQALISGSCLSLQRIGCPRLDTERCVHKYFGSYVQQLLRTYVSVACPSHQSYGPRATRWKVGQHDPLIKLL